MQREEAGGAVAPFLLTPWQTPIHPLRLGTFSQNESPCPLCSQSPWHKPVFCELQPKCSVGVLLRQRLPITWGSNFQPVISSAWALEVNK